MRGLREGLGREAGHSLQRGSRPRAASASAPRRAAQRLVAVAAHLVLWLLSLPPDETGLRIGAALGRLLYRLTPGRAGVARVNLRIAFPEWSEERRLGVLRESFADLGRGLVEVAQLRRCSDAMLRERTEIQGLEHLEAARAASPTGGVVVLTAHLGNWELLAAAMAARALPITIVHRARENPHLERLITGWRRAGGLDVVERGSAARAVLRALRAGRIVALPLDQNTNLREGIFVPFFHRLACTRDGPARIAMRTGAPVVPIFIRRVGRSARHRVCVEPPLELVAAGTDRQAAVRENVERMNRAIERAIRAAPAQWFWMHRRWKAQPPGEVRPYPAWDGPRGLFRPGARGRPRRGGKILIEEDGNWS